MARWHMEERPAEATIHLGLSDTRSALEKKRGCLEAMSTLVKIALAAQLVLLLSAWTAFAHFLQGDSVNDQSGELRWEDRTRYDDARNYAIDQWDALGRVPILRDSANTPTDLVFRDYRDCGTGVVGNWAPGEGPDSINLNVCSMEKQSKSTQPATLTHELGHALRLAHPSGIDQSEYWRKRSIMYYCSSCVPFSAPQAHDKADYREIW